MRSVSQQGFSRRVEYGCERCRVSKRGPRSNLAVNAPRAVGSFRQPYTITRGRKEYYFTTGAQASLPAFLRLTTFRFQYADR